MERRDRLEERLNPKRLFTEPNFDLPRYRNTVLGPLPDLEAYQKERQKLVSRRATVAPFLRPCYEEPVLSKQQEQHLFRQYSYWKYQASKRLAQNQFASAERLLAKADDVRRWITACNLRLAVSTAKRFYRYDTWEETVSDAYGMVLHTVDYFDYRRGFKFSTYLVWSVTRNLGRPKKASVKSGAFATFTDVAEVGDILLDRGPEPLENLVAGEIPALVEGLLGPLSSRQREIVIGYYGNEQTLKELGRRFKITKERVRQIRNSAIQSIRAACHVGE